MLLRRTLVLLIAAPLLACSGKSNDAPPAQPDTGTPKTDSGKVDSAPDTAPPNCGPEPRFSLQLNMGLLDATGGHSQKGVKVRSSLCAASDYGVSNDAGLVQLFISANKPQTLRMEYDNAVPGIDGELTMTGDDFLPGWVLVDKDVAGIIPGYDAGQPVLHVQAEIFEADACPDRSGVAFEVVGAPGAKITYFQGYKATKDAVTSVDGRAFITGVPVSKTLEVKGTRAGCNFTTARRGYSGKYTTEPGAMTFVTVWAVK